MGLRLYQGDCLELMRYLPDKSVDMILCDLPYGMTKNKWDSIIPFEPLWAEYKRIRKDNAACVLFAAFPFTASLVMSNQKEFKYVWTWYKHYRVNFLNARKQPMRATEQIAVFYRGKCTYNPQMTRGICRNKGQGGKKSTCYGDYKRQVVKNDLYYPTDILDFPGVPRGKNRCPTEKPVPLLEYLVRTYTNDGGTVLDNCMGAGSTGVACVNTGRDFIGMELDAGYFNAARERIVAAWQKNRLT